MHQLRMSGLAALVALSCALGPVGAARAQVGPEGTPQIDAGLETLSYAEASTQLVVPYWWIVMSGVDSFPLVPEVDQVKGTDLRKRILNLRLMMDFTAFMFDPGLFEAYRDATDDAYEQIGHYKDLYDVQLLDGAPILPNTLAERQAKMNVALAPFRLGSLRDAFKDMLYQRTGAPQNLDWKNQPRIWQIARQTPTNGLDAVGNAARLGQSALRNLRSEGLLVSDIFDPQQELRFHDVRKAIRSIELIADMFPSLAAATANVRDPLDKVVSAYGKANDQIIAYQLAKLNNRDVDRRAQELSVAFARAQDRARDFADNGALEAFASAMQSVENSHRR